MADLTQEVNDIWYHLRGNGEVGLLEQTRRNTETLAELQQDVKDVKATISELVTQRQEQAAELRGFKRGLYIASALLAVLGTGGGAIILNLLNEIAAALQ